VFVVTSFFGVVVSMCPVSYENGSSFLAIKSAGPWHKYEHLRMQKYKNNRKKRKTKQKHIKTIQKHIKTIEKI